MSTRGHRQHAHPTTADTKVIVLVDKDEYKYVDKLNKIIKLHDILKYQVNNEKLQESLSR